MKESLFAFVLMPFDAAFDDVYKLGVKETTEKLGIIAERVDEQVFHKENILERIYNQINAADLVIADMTGRNTNVFYEVGYAHAKGKMCILVTANADDIPFDLKHHRHIVYGTSITALRHKLETDLRSIEAQLKTAAQPILVELRKPTGDLEKTKYQATAKVDLSFDFHNRSERASPEIEAVYLYTGKGWTYQIEGQECPSIASDMKAFDLRHLVRLPVRRLQKESGWAQVTIKGTKILAHAWKGETLEDKYRISGRSRVRVVTAEKPFDFDFNIDLEVEEWPF
jgi:nucleoside 2-deoxyribosyltransferase